MRPLQTDETALLEASRQAEKRRVDEEERGGVSSGSHRKVRNRSGAKEHETKFG